MVQRHSLGQEPVFVIVDDDDFAARTTDGDTVRSDTDVDTDWEMEESSLLVACSLVTQNFLQEGPVKPDRLWKLDGTRWVPRV